MGNDKRFQCGSISLFRHPKADTASVAPDYSHNRRAITRPRAMATRLVGSPARWIKRVAVFATFLTGILIQFVGLGHWVG